jgi:hypothetical protein
MLTAALIIELEAFDGWRRAISCDDHTLASPAVAIASLVRPIARPVTPMLGPLTRIPASHHSKAVQASTRSRARLRCHRLALDGHVFRNLLDDATNEEHRHEDTHRARHPRAETAA